MQGVSDGRLVEQTRLGEVVVPGSAGIRKTGNVVTGGLAAGWKGSGAGVQEAFWRAQTVDGPFNKYLPTDDWVRLVGRQVVANHR